SLWNRAVSSDICGKLNIGWGKIVSIPLEQGSVFRQKKNKKHQKQSVSIPLEQGSVFRQLGWNWTAYRVSLNPFGTGQCLPTFYYPQNRRFYNVSIPLEQGSVFRLQWYFEALWHKAYESHFPTFSET
ncbi:hypothetical protein, partial [Haemophilus parahaemolyticus]|uniref:hypothetical protein n=1 Tax=Haemophilus parahaemolyticus TaxID=735 RepID=UPI0040380AF8